jgi:hypothetical protein
MALRDSARPPAVSRNGIVVSSVEPYGGRFAAVDISGAVVGSFCDAQRCARGSGTSAALTHPMLP